MAKLIDAWDAAAAVSSEFGISMGKLTELFDKLPSAYPKTGKWEKRPLTKEEDPYGFFRTTFRCDRCGGITTYGESDFCPECGADMRCWLHGGGENG